MATIDDFQKLDIRVGKIIEVNDFPEARKPSYKLTIDFGTEIGIKHSSAQLVKFYKGEEVIFIGRKYALEGDKTLSLEYQTISSLGIPFKSITTGRLQRKFTKH